MSRILTSFFMLVPFVLGAQEPARPGSDDGPLPANGIAARVNRDIITWREVDERIGFDPEEGNRDSLRRETRKKMVEDLLFLQAAREHGITVTDQEIDEQVRRERKPFETDEEYLRFLRDFHGVTRAQNRVRIGRDIRIKKLYYFLVRQAYTNPKERKEFIPLMVDFVTPAEVRQYYAEHRAQFEAKEYVYLARIGFQYSGPKEKALKERLAAAALRKLDEGTDFFVLASRMSDVFTEKEGRKDFTLQIKQGDDFFSESTMTLLFDTLERGEYSGIVEEGNTLNIFQLIQRVRRRQETFDEVQGRITRFLESRKREENRQRLLQILVRRAFLEPADIFGQR